MVAVEKLVPTVPQGWKCMSDFPQDQWLQWKRIHSETKKIFYKELDIRLEQNNEILNLFHLEMEKLQTQMTYPHLFFLVDLEGIILDIIGENTLHTSFKPLVVQKGSSMALESGGINAISIALQTGSRVFLKGDEHQLPFFKGWLCLCCPIKVRGEIIAYLNFSRPTPFIYDSIFALVSSLIYFIESQLERGYNDKSRVQALFNTYRFTVREQEVATLWLQNKGALYISEKLSITEGTVRNFVKKIYTKCSVNDRGGFIQKFYQA